MPADFILEIPRGREARILQLSDPQVIESEQERFEGRLGGLYDRWRREKKDRNYRDCIRETVKRTSPDLIFITGDLVYGEFDDTGEALLEFVSFMESFQIPWAPVFGNHENDSKKGVLWQCEQLEKAEHCRFLARPIEVSHGNYSLLLTQGGAPLRLFVFLDSGGFLRSAGITEGQKAFYRDAVARARALRSDLPLSFVTHIQPVVFRDAFRQYSPDLTFPIDVDLLGKEGDFGWVGRDVKGVWDEDYSFFEEIRALGADSLFVGHEHCSNASIVYRGVRLQYGQKSSRYDRLNHVVLGDIVGGYGEAGTAILGGTAFSLGEGGEILSPHLVLV